MRTEFRLFIGVDQTGASAQAGRAAKPLSCAVVVFDKRSSRWRLEVFDSQKQPLRLASFNRATIEALASLYDCSLGETALAVDCVMGLAREAWPSCNGGSEPLWSLFAQAARDEVGVREGYGLKPAAAFFDAIRARAHLTSRPARRCEILSRANSVFNTHPFQKNVQCGTYRIWRDLGAENLSPHRRWLRFWNFDPLLRAGEISDQAWFFEAYPSLFWRDILGARTRDITELRERVRTVFADKIDIADDVWSLLEADADHADSAVLALGAWLLQERGTLFMSGELPREKWLKREGWILGLPYSGLATEM